MRTHRHITSRLEREITASALMTFRLIGKPDEVSTKWFHFYSSSSKGILDSPYDECVANVGTWQLERIYYDVWEGDKIVRKTIELIT